MFDVNSMFRIFILNKKLSKHMHTSGIIIISQVFNPKFLIEGENPLYTPHKFSSRN
jgi:hypothetical protein